MTRLSRRILLGAALTLPGIARAQGFPARPLRLVVPFPPGGAADITARLVAERMGALLGQSVVIDNRPGAGGNIAGEVVARSAPDGHTLFLGGATILCANKYLYRNGMPFDGLADFTHISRVSVGTTLLVVRADKPWQSFQDLVADAKRRPGQISAGSSGLGTISHLSLSKMMRSAGIDITHVPYRGLAPSLNDLIAGNVDVIFDGIPAIIPHVREGRLRALAVGSQQRVGYVPGLERTPGMAELLPGSGMDMEFWYCISGAAGTPAPIAAALHRATVAAVRQDSFRERLTPLGFTPVWDESPEALTAFIRAQDAVWRELVEVSGARLD
ncbi:tripartite tricarboxylate transporter substrate binding protein [Roseomonas sp. HF4]|uniref:Bug family tripartite tricarboxylate transporter substrate binding protein n=1 Tax=Roseomonas sp. HF4 TaxID=2562313 RepID=UPI0010BFBD56|nr:tripartite tricarboxylate transporter substrate binding protein [Roseomonas sp. HF4]